MTQDMNHTFVKALRAVFVAVMMSLTGSHALAQVTVHGNVYGGGNLADVKTNTLVNMSAGTVAGNVFGGGKGDSNNFTCDKAMVGKEEDDNKCEDPGSVDNKDKGTKVIITNGTVGTLDGNGKLVEGTGNVYGGGEIGRVEWNTQVTIGEEGASGSGAAPDIKGSVFGAGKGLETHGYSALVRGNSTVIVQGKAKVRENVYGGGEMATVGRYWVKNIPTTKCEGELEPEPPGDLPNGMPYQQRKGGICRVTIQGNAQIGPDSGGTEDAGHVFGAGKGVDPHYSEGESKRMTQEYGMQIFTDDDELHKTAEELYYEFLQTLALVTNSYVTIDGSAAVKGSVYGGSMSGFVQHNTEVNILGGEIGTDNTYGDVFGGGLGLKKFAEAGKVKGNTKVDITGGNVQGNVYGGGSLGDVGIIDKTDQTDYNYKWKKSDGSTANDTEINKKADLNTNTGICKVSISGGTIGVPSPADATKQGNVFGAGRGSDITWWCEKAISYAASVTVTGGIVNGNVYGGGQIGRVEDDAKVTIGTANETGNSKPTITGSVFGAGAGLHTHGYSALVRGNTDVTVQGAALVGGSVYGGGETASVGKFRVDKGLPKEPLSGGYCTVTIQDNAKIGLSGTEHNVYGACKGVDPITISAGERKSMQLVKNKPEGAKGTTWDDYEDADGNQDDRFIWRIYSEAEYPTFVRTLALTSHPHVTIAEDATVNGSVYGGGQRGITLGNVDVDITGGTVYQDVYGGGALADTNAGNWDADGFTEVTGLTEASSVTGLYERSGAGTSDSPYKYTITEDVTANSGKIYYSKGKWANASLMTGYYKTTVNLMGGLIKGDAYGGGLGQKNGFNGKTSDIAAVVHGDIRVNLGSNGSSATSFLTSYYTDEGHTNVVKSGRVFGCNNLMGSPEGSVTVDVWKTVAGKDGTDATINRTPETKKKLKEGDEGYVAHTYEVAAVYGGGNLADFTTVGKKANVIIETCDVSVQSVYGGGNAAEVPGTDVLVKGAYEIQEVFGGGNGKDPYTTDGGTSWTLNGGANIGNSTNPGNANTLLTGGLIHAAYGGSNEKGTIYGNVQIDVGTGGECTLDVEKMVGAGKNADVNGSLIMILGCKPSEKIPVLYAGADQANVNGNVELTITSGNYGEVYGGNNLSGAIRGHIKLNIEETGDCETPITIEKLYLGGNQAAYSVYGYYVKTKTDVVDRKKILKGDPNDPEEIAVMSTNGKLILLPRESASDPHMPVKSYEYDEDQEKWTWEVYPGAYNEEEKKWYWTVSGEEKDVLYVQPEMNIISCTRIDEVFGGGYGSTAIMYCDPVVNINMIPGTFANDNTKGVLHVMSEKGISALDNPNKLGIVGDVYGGGDAAAVYGNTTVNIGTVENVLVKSWSYNEETKVYTAAQRPVQGVYINGNVYGGGKLANVGAFREVTTQVDGKPVTNDVIDVEGSTSVNIGAVKNTEILDGDNHTGRFTYTSVSYEGASSITIAGSVYGGGKGAAIESGAGAFRCAQAMVTKHTNVAICNGTVKGDVYGGGEKGRVQENTAVTIGSENDEDSAPVITGSVFGAGKGVNTHGYSALVRGNSYVTVQGEAKVKKSVYGGGEIASVGKYNINAQGLPESLANQGSGYCTVIVQDNAVIGPDAAMVMTASGYPDDIGHVFGAGKGVLPYEGYEDPDEKAWRVKPDNTQEEYLSLNEAIRGGDEDDYLKYVETLGLATQTYVTISENAFIKGSVYGGSENGYVQHDTQVNILGNCQIGNGYVQMDNNGIYLDKLQTPETPMGVNRRYTDDEWAEGHLIPDQTKERELYDLVYEKYYTTSLPECASWPYGQATGDNKYAPWDKFAGTAGYDSKGGRTTADDGHTFYGNVFGGGSGLIPYRPGKWHPEAGSVGGNTVVNITGGHILTNVYGGNELTDVYGTCTVNFGGTATLGVPRTLKQIDAHPLTCYLFGAGKGDQRVLFNKSTNVEEVAVHITGGRIYGSVFGGGEDGHVHRDVTMTIGGSTTKIGTWGTSYVDGNVFGAGRGFGGDAYTAGNVAGSVTMTISGGEILGSIYGGGRLGSVGYGLFNEGVSGYGEMRPDNTGDDGSRRTIPDFLRGHVNITISGGTIGNIHEYIIPNAANIIEAGIPETNTDISTWNETNKYWDIWKNYHNVPKTDYDPVTGRLTHTKGGNVYAGGMGRRNKLNGDVIGSAVGDIDWTRLGCVKQTRLTISGDAVIKSNVYGGGELGAVIPFVNGNAVQGGTTEIEISGTAKIGTEVKTGTGESKVVHYTFGSVFGGGMGSEADTSTEEKIGGRIQGSTKITMLAGTVRGSVYGGGELALVQGSHTTTDSKVVGTEVNISGGFIGYNQDGFGGATMGNVYGGGKGSLNTANAGLIKNNTLVNISGSPTIYHNIYGGGAYGSVGTFTFSTGIPTACADNTGKAEVIISGGTIGINGRNNGMVFGSSRGDVGIPVGTPAVDPNDKLAWTHNTHVVIGSSGSPTIKGTVYGSGENGHVFTNTVVDIHNGTIGIASGAEITYTEKGQTVKKSGAAYPYRGNVYGGGCGTDMYDSDGDGTEDTYNPLAGIVLGNATLTIDGGQVVRNVYGAGAMGSVGKVVSTTTNNVTTTTTTGGLTTINISGGTIGVSGTVGDGNVFGAARGDKNATGNDLALVRLANVRETSVTISDGTINGNVYGGGEVGSVGTYTVSTVGDDYMKNYTFENGTGACSVTINGGTIGTNVGSVDGIFANGNVYGAGKGLANTFWCEKGMVYSTNVEINAGTVYGTVYGGGEVGRVENNATVTIGISDPSDDTVAPSITGNVFGAGAGLETHGYSALLRGDTEVTVQGNAHVGGSVYGGGEKASVGRFVVIGGTPKEPENDGSGDSKVTVQGNAVIAGSVFGTCQGVTPHYYTNVVEYPDTAQMPKRMMAITMGKFDDSTKAYWRYVSDDDHDNVWEYLYTKQKYLDFLPTLALASHPEVTIGGSAAIGGSVYGGGQRGITLGTVAVNITGGTVTEDVYGGGALADTNKGNWDASTGTWASYKSSATFTTTVNLTGGTINGTAYGGGLGDATTEALVYGDVMVKLNETTASDNCVVKGSIFGCNNVNGTPKGDVTVHVYKTQGWTDDCGTESTDDDISHDVTTAKLDQDSPRTDTVYELTAVYGGGNNAAYVPADAYDEATQTYKTGDTRSTNVIIDGCSLTSIETVYGGGNAASAPGTNVTVNSCYEIGTLFAGGNGAGDGNPGANVGYLADNTTPYGTGKSYAELKGGTIHKSFGGSNSKGNVRFSATVDLNELDRSDENYCQLCIDEVYGAGNEADQDGSSNINLGCISFLSEIYGGAKNADISNDIDLTIQSGRFNRVFGGNNLGGNISGTITVNIEETGCHPIVIGQLFGGGNQAAYTAPTGQHGPTLYVKSFTSIGEIYGGGYGGSATVTGDTYVNINECKGKYADRTATVDFTDQNGVDVYENSDRVKVSENTGKWIHFVAGKNQDNSDKISTVWQPEHREGAIGTIGNVFGGGNEAGVVGNTNINIGNKEYVDITTNIVVGETDVRDCYIRTGEGTEGSPYVYSEVSVKAVANTTYYQLVVGEGDTETYEAIDNNDIVVGTTDVSDYYTRSGEGTEGSPYVYSKVPIIAQANTTYYKKVLGVNITGNVYGGGNAADVSGDTNVSIGK